MASMFYEKDCDIKVLDGKTVAIIGYGSQAHAHALNLRDSGVNVVIGAREGGGSWNAAAADGFEVMSIADATTKGDVVMLLIVDDAQPAVFEAEIKPHLTAGKALGFAHGFNIRYGFLQPPADVDVFMAAPKGPGHTVRGQFVAGKGVPSLIAIEQDATGKAYDVAKAYLAGIGGARAGILETTMHEETETDLFGEQVVLCGGVVDLMRCAFEVLIENGYSPENAYFECLHELKLIIDIVNKGGITGLHTSISDTAEYGEYVSGPRVVPHEETKARMREVLTDIQDGTFADAWLEENKNGRKWFYEQRAALEKHPMEVIGRELREKMLWQGDDNLDTASN